MEVALPSEGVGEVLPLVEEEEVLPPVVGEEEQVLLVVGEEEVPPMDLI